MTKVTAVIVRAWLLGLFAALGAGLLSCQKETTAPAKPRLDFNGIIQMKNREFLATQTADAKVGIDVERSRIQDQLFQEFERCPQCFVKKFVGAQRTYLFDAVTDCDTALRVGTPFDGGKWVCDPESLPNPSIVYSFGVGDNISFERGLGLSSGAPAASAEIRWSPTPKRGAPMGSPKSHRTGTSP